MQDNPKIPSMINRFETPTALVCLYIYLVYLYCKCLSCHFVYFCLLIFLTVCLSVRLCTCLSVWRLKTTKTWKSISPKDKTRHFCSSNKWESNSHRWLFAAVDLDMLTSSLLQSGKVSIRKPNAHTDANISVPCGQWASSGSANFTTFTHLQEKEGREERGREIEREREEWVVKCECSCLGFLSDSLLRKHNLLFVLIETFN